MHSKTNSLTDEPIRRLLLRLSVPAIISMMVTNIYNIADTAFVGMLGTSESGATGIVFSFMTILQAVAFMCGQGSGSILSRLLGAKKEKEATKFASTGFFLSFFFGGLLGLFAVIWIEPLLRFLGSTDTILPYAKIYVLCIALAGPFFTSSLTLNNILRYEGKAKLGTIGMMTGAFLNIGLDALLMRVFHMGILGAGIATTFSQIVSFLILLSMFIRGKTQTRISVRYITRDIKDTLNIIATGSPSLLRQGLASISGILLNQYASAYGDPAISALSCVSRISFFTMAVAIGIGQGFQPISSFNYGAGRKDRVKEAFQTALTGEELVVILLSVPMFFFAPLLIRLMRDDPEVIAIGTRTLRLFCIAQPFVPLSMMVEMGFQSIGQRLLAILGSSLRSGLLLIPTIILLAKFRGLSGIEEAQPLSYILAFIVCIFLSRIYIRKLDD